MAGRDRSGNTVCRRLVGVELYGLGLELNRPGQDRGLCLFVGADGLRIDDGGRDPLCIRLSCVAVCRRLRRHGTYAPVYMAAVMRDA